jgi:hypothetical protein
VPLQPPPSFARSASPPQHPPAFALGAAPAAAGLATAGAPEHPQLGSVPVSQPRMIADAQPTPGLSVIAPEEQFSAQAPHSMHAPKSTMTARLSAIAKTP